MISPQATNSYRPNSIVSSFFVLVTLHPKLFSSKINIFLSLESIKEPSIKLVAIFARGSHAPPPLKH